MNWPESKRPLLVELTGTPEAGKSTAMKLLQSLLEQEGYRVGLLQEAAELLPNNIPKGTWNSNLWITLHVLKSLFEISHMNNFDIILIDRGYIDRFLYSYQLLKSGSCTMAEYETLIQYLKLFIALSPDSFPNELIVFKVSPEKAIERKGGEGRIVTKSFIAEYNATLDECLKTFSTLFAPVKTKIIDTSFLSTEKVVSACIDYITSYYDIV